MRNRLADIRAAKGLTLDDLAKRMHRSTSAMGRLERGDNELKVEDLLALASILDVAPHEIVPELAPTAPQNMPTPGFADDVAPYRVLDGATDLPLPNNRFRHAVTSNVLDAIGIRTGSDVIVDIGADAVAGARTGDAVMIRYTPPGGRVTTLLRQYVEPGLFVVNSHSIPAGDAAARPLSERTDDVQLIGIVVEMIQRVQRRP